MHDEWSTVEKGEQCVAGRGAGDFHKRAAYTTYAVRITAGDKDDMMFLGNFFYFLRVRSKRAGIVAFDDIDRRKK